MSTVDVCQGKEQAVDGRLNENKEVAEMPESVVDPLALFRLDGQVAVVTGASSGIGERAARVLDRLGAKVIVAARRAERLEVIAASMYDGHPYVCDVSEAGASAAMVDRIVADYERLDIVVANAGIAAVMPAIRESVTQFLEIINVDLVAPFELMRAAAIHMRDQKHPGTLINVASGAAFASSAFLPQASYVAAKTGLVGLTRELALQWARYGVRVNALCPGMFSSEMTAELVESDELRGRFEEQVPMKRIGRVEELDGAIAFLASSASSYVTGQTILIDGGGKV